MPSIAGPFTPQSTFFPARMPKMEADPPMFGRLYRGAIFKLGSVKQFRNDGQIVT